MKLSVSTHSKVLAQTDEQTQMHDRNITYPRTREVTKSFNQGPWPNVFMVVSASILVDRPDLIQVNFAQS